MGASVQEIIGQSAAGFVFVFGMGDERSPEVYGFLHGTTYNGEWKMDGSGDYLIPPPLVINWKSTGELLHHLWQPIETAPKDGSLIWAYRPSRLPELRQVVMWWAAPKDCVEYWRDAGDSFEPDNPTHWMPLPHPPTT